MLPTIKSELRKLLTTRGTYICILAAVALTLLMAGVGFGFKGAKESLLANDAYTRVALNAVTLTVFTAIGGLLLMGNEYRHNTILYTLTAVNKRSKIIAAKFLVVSVYAVVSSLIVVGVALASTVVGAGLAHKTIGSQHFDVWAVLGKCIFYGWAISIYAYIFAVLLRSQVSAIVSFLILPLMGEGLLSLVLKDNVKYLPFTALSDVVTTDTSVSAQRPLLTVLCYVVASLLVATFLFNKRDAN